ncbi:peptidylprolyl isomerase [Chengkuizengella sp. SCS-71B]|uniref:peptidylprolyl isomerase n=1 Tax=Chengkuizengella sp. SCS-71B TaxID=3115290 RepID=UPI0032C2177F
MQQGKLKWMTGLLLSLSLVLIISACGQDDNEKNDTSEDNGSTDQVETFDPTKDKNNVAEYEGGEITLEEYNDFIGVMKLLYTPEYVDQLQSTPGFSDNLVKQLIAFELLGEEADEETKKEQQTISETNLEEFKSQYEVTNGEGSWNTGLKDAGIEEEDFKNFIYISNISQEVLRKDISEKEVKAEYDRILKDNPTQWVEATVSHILVKTNDPGTGEEIRTEEEALEIMDEIKAKLDEGEDFGALAKEYSEDEGSKNNGGTYENANINNWVEEFKLAAAAQPIGEIGEPVKTVYGYHIIKVDNRTELSFDDVKEGLITSLVQQELQDYSTTEVSDLITGVSIP